VTIKSGFKQGFKSGRWNQS